MRIIGVDLHARQQTIAMLDSDTGELKEKTIPEGRGFISVNDRRTVSVPFVYPEARRAQPHPRKPFRVISYSSLDTEFLIETPRLEIAATTRRTNNMQNSNRDKMRVSRPLWIDGLQWHRHSCLCAFARLSTRRMPNALGSLPLKILIANTRLDFNVSNSKDNRLRISNRERIAISHPRFHALAQTGRRAATRPPKVQPRLPRKAQRPYSKALQTSSLPFPRHAMYSSFQPRASSLQNPIANLELEISTNS